jgi:hypothetical protein
MGDRKPPYIILPALAKPPNGKFGLFNGRTRKNSS